MYTVGTGTIFITIMTTNCSFNSTPLYYTSISGNTMHMDFTGYNSIYAADKNSFTIYIRNLQGFTIDQMLNYSQMEQWNVSWVGVY